MRTSRIATIVTGIAAAATLAACGYNEGPVSTYPSNYPGTYPATYPSAYPGNYPSAYPAPSGYLEYGRVTNIELFQSGAAPRSGANVGGAIIGAVAGAVIGNQVGRSIGSDGTRDRGTVLGGVAGAVVGSQVGRPTGGGGYAVYRVTVQTEQGAWRSFDVPATGDLRIGDRVRVENGVIYRS